MNIPDALLVVCRRCCIPDQHDPACRALHDALGYEYRWEWRWVTDD